MREGDGGGDKFLARSFLALRTPSFSPHHLTSPDLIRGLLHRSTRVEASVGPGSAAGEVRWWGE